MFGKKKKKKGGEGGGGALCIILWENTDIKRYGVILVYGAWSGRNVGCIVYMCHISFFSMYHKDNGLKYL